VPNHSSSIDPIVNVVSFRVGAVMNDPRPAGGPHYQACGGWGLRVYVESISRARLRSAWYDP